VPSVDLLRVSESRSRLDELEQVAFGISHLGEPRPRLDGRRRRRNRFRARGREGGKRLIEIVDLQCPVAEALGERSLEWIGEGLLARSLALDQLDPYFAQTYVRFASRQPTLIELMFASLHRPEAHRSLREANDRAFAGPVSLIAGALDRGEIAAADPDRVAMTVLATLQGLAWLANSTVIGDRPMEAVVTDAIKTLSRGLER
jgi:hypothetical protein